MSIADPALQGIIPPLATSFTEHESLDEAALALRGRPVGPPRHPLLPSTPAVVRQIRQALVVAEVDVP